MSRALETAKSQQSNSGPTPPFVAGKNAIINGGMDIWQRGTSFTGTGVYTADRWYNGSNSAQTFSRQTTSDTTNLPSIQYCIRAQRNSGTSNTNIVGISQSIETVNSIPIAGKTVTVSYYARAGANLSGTVTATLYSGTGTDQRRDYGAGFTGEAIAVTANPTLTTTWTRYTITGTVATTATELAVLIYFVPAGTAGAADYIEITGVQLELGSTATPFSRAGGTIQGELAACQRYYWRNSADTAYTYVGSAANAWSTTEADLTIQNPVPMRVPPTSVEYSTLILSTRAAGSTYTVTSASLASSAQSKMMSQIRFGVASGLTAAVRYDILANNSTNAYLALSAEL